jgi:molecular chaperone GrpE
MAGKHKEDTPNQTTGFNEGSRGSRLGHDALGPPLFRRRKTDFDARLAEANDRSARAAADLDNYRKRFDRELARLRAADQEEIFFALLDVVDNMDRALQSAGIEASTWHEGMEAIRQQMIMVLSRFDVAPFRAVGQMFNPELHEAVSTVSIPGEPEGKIIEVVQTGYTLNGKVLRAAKVVPVRNP